MEKKQKVALVLGSGGARGVAHIGAIEELERQGFEITSVAGTSMGALVGGIYASGGLPVYREWMCSLDMRKMISLMDFTLSFEGLVKGTRVLNEIKKMVPDMLIEQCRIPFAAVATDILLGQEVVFESGSLYDAIRASISIPSLFKPLRVNNYVLVDGGVINPLPLNRVKRSANDLLIAVDVSAPSTPRDEHMLDHMKKANIHLHEDDREVLNYYTLLSQSSVIMQQQMAQLMMNMYRPDILIRIPKDTYKTLDFYKSEEILALGEKATQKALDLWRKRPV